MTLLNPTNEVPTTFRGVDQFVRYTIPEGGKPTAMPTFFGAVETAPEPSEDVLAAAAFYHSWADEWGDDEDYV